MYLIATRLRDWSVLWDLRVISPKCVVLYLDSNIENIIQIRNEPKWYRLNDWQSCAIVCMIINKTWEFAYGTVSLIMAMKNDIDNDENKNTNELGIMCA